jgi:hypothetical protein
VVLIQDKWIYKYPTLGFRSYGVSLSVLFLPQAIIVLHIVELNYNIIRKLYLLLI